MVHTVTAERESPESDKCEALVTPIFGGPVLRKLIQVGPPYVFVEIAVCASLFTERPLKQVNALGKATVLFFKGRINLFSLPYSHEHTKNCC